MCLFIRNAINTSEANAITAGKFITFTVILLDTSFNSLAFSYIGTVGSAANFSVRSSADSYATTIGSGTLTTLLMDGGASINLSSVPGLQNVSTAQTFRVYFWGGATLRPPRASIM